MSDASKARYELYYWPSIQGRGEFVRLLFEDGGTPYIDVARLSEKEGGGVRTLMKFLHGDVPGALPFAPPFLKHGDLVVSQTANILAYLGPQLDLVPPDEPSRLYAHQLELTLADLVGETHDVHHPIGPGLYYEDQKNEAKKRAADFVGARIPKYLSYFERVLERNEAGRGLHLVGRDHSYVDLSMFQVLAGLSYAFPKAMARLSRKTRHLASLRERVEQRPRIAAYLASERRLPFSEEGIFRHYPALDIEPS